MYKLLNKEYKKVKESYKKSKNDLEHDKELRQSKISLYSIILGYYSAKVDFGDINEKSKNKIILESYDKLLLKYIALDKNLESLTKSQNYNKKESFDDNVDFIKKTLALNNNYELNIIVTNFNRAYELEKLELINKKSNIIQESMIERKCNKLYKKLTLDN